MRKLVSDLVLLAALLSGCGESGTYEYGVDLTKVTFEVTDLTMGVHPSRSVLDDPNNPFAAGISEETKWIIESHDDTTPDYSGSAARFYAWSTILTAIPLGENQLYAATALHDMFLYEEVAPSDLVFVRDMAVAGYQSVLDNFPDSVSYDESGTFSFPLAPVAYAGILALGAVPQGGWVEITTEDGTILVQQGF